MAPLTKYKRDSYGSQANHTNTKSSSRGTTMSCSTPPFLPNTQNGAMDKRKPRKTSTREMFCTSRMQVSNLTFFHQTTNTTVATPGGGSSKLPRKLTIFGSPWTPQYGISAFQYRLDDIDHWASWFTALQSSKPDIVVTHGPPKHHLATCDIHRAGCPYLAHETSQLRPRLVVFGHVHASYGREDIVFVYKRCMKM